jgi:exo-beta-1,3-glucanase (GH17 family)
LTFGFFKLEAIVQTKVNMTVYLANYPDVGDNNAAYDRQKQEIQQALQTYGTSNIEGIIVGNEYILKCVCSISTGTRDTLNCGVTQLPQCQ